MKTSFDGGRRKLAERFNYLAINQKDMSFSHCEKLDSLRSAIAVLLCMEDEREQPEDCNCLIDMVQLTEIYLGGDKT
jgi:hypothetical protein